MSLGLCYTGNQVKLHEPITSGSINRITSPLACLPASEFEPGQNGTRDLQLHFAPG